MKIIHLLLALTLVPSVYGQDYCKRIQKEVAQDKKTFEFASPFNPNEKPALKVFRNFNTDPEFAYDNFFIVFRLEIPLDSIYKVTADGSQTEKDEKSLVVEFDDHSKIIDDTIHINHDVSDDHTLAVRYLDYPITNVTEKDFSTKKIIRFSLAGTYQPVITDSANSIMHYVQCMKDLK